MLHNEGRNAVIYEEPAQCNPQLRLVRVESAAMGRFLIVGFLFSAVCACLGRPQDPAAATVAPPAAPVPATTAAAAGTPWFQMTMQLMSKWELFGKIKSQTLISCPAFVCVQSLGVEQNRKQRFAVN